MVGIYHGNKKPSNANKFLLDFVNDCIFLINNRIHFGNKWFNINTKGIICDAPAKSFRKFIKGHTGYSSCTKCFIQGECRDKMYFPDIADDLHLRTNTESRSQIDEDHPLGKSIL